VEKEKKAVKGHALPAHATWFLGIPSSFEIGKQFAPKKILGHS
jgi:hypothetical protein